ncbi:hypothetical protein mumin63_gp058 [Flavobacterium phage vB_FspS_mumin6-3]|uniref:Uncharacterized protein n=1 Tax=Flavobacterium phage vB_FspS_mumin6-3 TaxID=2686261 RepID=A0A6B9LRL5_9CAUD|nr:hypothetical protein mumin63_gp058 [Flavobacterium phage vB_FspS_mumin6-3]
MFKHYLNFADLPLIGRIEISEPFKFDGSTHEIKREKGRHSRDVIIANQDIDLELEREHFELLDIEQTLPDGTIFNLASHGFDYLINEINSRGWEMSVEYIINYNGTDFTTGEIDGLTYKVSDNELSIKITQNTLYAYIKKNDSVKIDAFSDKSLTDLDIEPCTTTDIFLKAKPLLQASDWESIEADAFGFSQTNNRNDVNDIPSTIRFGANNCLIVKSYGIEDTLNSFESRYVLNSLGFPNDGLNFQYLEAKNTLTDIKISITDLDAYTRQSKNDFFANIVLSGSGYVRFVIKYGFDTDVPNMTTIVLYERFFGFVDSSPIVNLPNSFDVTIPVLEQGMRLYVYLEPYSEATFNQYSSSSLANYTVYATMESMKMSITATSTALSTIVKGVRLYDLLRHQANSYDTILTDNGVFNNTSEYWNNFCFNGRMLGNLANNEFNNEFKQLYNSVCDEAFADYQITNEGIEIDFINNYYKDEEIAVFTELPSNDYNYTANSDYSINLFNVKFKKSSSDRTGNEVDTIDDVHTSLQLKMPSKKADAIYNLEFYHIRSAQLIEEQRRKGNEVNGKTRVLENDENLFVLDCVELAPSTTNEFTQFLRYRILDTDNKLEIVSNGTFAWTNLGMVVGQTISISFVGLPSGTNFEILALEDFTIRLLFLNNLPTSDSDGEKSITFNYILQGVQYTNRTNQGFTTIQGVANPDNYSNLKYSLKRITNKWLSFINTAGQYLIGQDAKVTEIKINDALETQLNTESGLVIDKANITLTENRILNGRVFSVKVFSDFDTATNLFNNVRDLKGYIRIILNSENVIFGYIKEARYTWRSNELILTLEEKFNNLITEINTLDVYNYNIVNNFVNLYDVNNLPLLTTKEFTKFSINGIIYDNIDDFTNNLIPLLNNE